MARLIPYVFIGLLSLFCLFSCGHEKTQDLVLLDFESDAALDDCHWKCHTLFSLSDVYAVHGEKSLKLSFFPSAYPGLSPALTHHDWRGYKTLSFEVYNPAPDPVKLVLRIDDKKQALEYSDRYNHSFLIQPGANTLSIPLKNLKTSTVDRPLNLKTIYRFLVFMSHPDKQYVLYLDYFRLIP